MSLNDGLAVFAVQPGRSEVKANAMDSESFEQGRQPARELTIHQRDTF